MRRKVVYTGLLMLVILLSTASAWSMGKTGDPAVVAVDGTRVYYPVYALDKTRVAPLLPSSYDYRKEGRAPKVKDQGNYGTCWAFASLTALESALMPGEKMDLSEDHMSLQNGFNLTQDDGGEYTMSMAYLLGWQGPVYEKDDPYGDGVSPQWLKPVKHVQEIQILPQKDYQKIKAAVYFRGGVQSSL